jgi:prepilin-type N-terminal cleavage/methylation domain-containing protein
MKRRRAFTLLEAMVVLAMFGVVASAASMAFVGMLRSTKRGHGALQAMNGTRATLDFILDEGRKVGGPDLPENARVLIDKGGGQKGTDVVWMMRQNTGYGVCAITGVSGTTLTFATVLHNGRQRCCFEAGEALADTPPVQGDVPAGAPFRRTAVLTDLRGRFLPVFLSGAPSPAACQLTMMALPGIDRVINGARNNLPDLTTGVAVLADVKRFYVDFEADGVRPPFGATFVQVELDGNVDSFVDERQRLSSNTYDFRAAVGYGQRQPELVEDESDLEDDDAFADDTGDDEDIPDVPEGNNPLLERDGDRGGWTDVPVPVVDGGEAPPTMLGIALQTGVGADTLPEPLPWSTRPRLAEGAQVMTLVGRVMFRSEGAP